MSFEEFVKTIGELACQYQLKLNNSPIINQSSNAPHLTSLYMAEFSNFRVCYYHIRDDRYFICSSTLKDPEGLRFNGVSQSLDIAYLSMLRELNRQ